MASYFTLDFLGDVIRGAAATATGDRRVRAVGGFTIDLKSANLELNAANAEAIAKLIRGEMARLRVSANACAVLLGRKLLSVKSATVPNVPDDELPSIIRFSLDDSAPGDAAFDFQPGFAEGGQRHATAIWTSKGTFDVVQAVLKGAKLRPLLVTARCFPIRHRASFGSPLGKTRVLLVERIGRTFEFSLWLGETLNAYRTVEIADDSKIQEILIGEIRRTAASFHAEHPDRALEGALFVGDFEPTSVIRIASAVNLTGFHLSDQDLRIDGIGASDDWRTAAVASADQTNCREIDLLKPKRNAVKSDGNRLKYLAAAGAATIVFALGYSYFAHQSRNQNDVIEQLNSKLGKIDEDIAARAKSLERRLALKPWIDDRVDWLEELNDLAAQFPDTSRVFLESATLDSGLGDRPTLISLSGVAKESGDFRNFSGKLIADPLARLRVDEKQSTSSSDASNRDFPWRFSLDLRAKPVSPEVYLERRKDWKAVEAAALGDGKERKPLARESERPRAAVSPPAASTPAGPVASSAATPSAVAATTTTTPTEPAAEGDDDPIGKFINEIKGLPADQLEAKIRSKPSSVQTRIRKRLKEGN